MRCLGLLGTALFLVAAPKLYGVTSSEVGGSSVGFVITLLVVIIAQVVVVIQASRVVDILHGVLVEHPIRSSLFLANAALMGWLTINVFTRLGILLLLCFWGAALLALCVGPRQNSVNLYTSLVRFSPISFVTIYLLLGAGECFLRFHPLLVGGGGGGNPALRRMYAGLYTINSHGLRGDEFSDIPPANVFRIVMLGDSFTFGQGVKDDETYPQQVGRLLDTRSGPRYEIINAGQSGTDTFEQLIRLRELCLKFKPDLVTVQFYLNDLEPRMQATSDPIGLIDRYLLYPAHRSYAIFFLKYRFERFRDQLKGSIDGVDARVDWVETIAQKVESEDAGWQRFCDAVDGFKEVSELESLPIVFALLPHPGLTDLDRLQRVHLAVRRRIEAVGLPVVDLVDVWAGLPADQQVVSAIDNHPSAKAHVITAERLVQELKKLKMLPNDLPGHASPLKKR